MKHFFTCIFLLCLTTLNLSARDFIIISEIMYDSPLNEQTIPNTPSCNGEFVELFNAGIDTINLSGWMLRGGSKTEIYNFPTNTKLAPQSFLIVAYQFSNSNFVLNQLYDGVITDSQRQVLYQNKIILSNSGEAVYIRDNSGVTKDSVFYDGNTSANIPNKLRADNSVGQTGNTCRSIQRKSITFDNTANSSFDRVQWVIAAVTIYQHNAQYSTPYLPDVSISYSYDYAGNRTRRRLIELNGMARARSVNSDQISLPIIESFGEQEIVIYPNPTKGALAVKINRVESNRESSEDETTITVFSSQGQQLIKQKAASDITSLDLSVFPSGWYILRISNIKKSTEFKIIKQ